MNAVLKSKQEAATALLAELQSPEDWRNGRAQEARDWLLQNGVASRRDHFWSYTDPALFYGELGEARTVLPEFEGLRLEADLETKGDGFEIKPLSKAEGAVYGDIVARAHEKGARPFAEIALAQAEGLVIDVHGDAGVMILDHSGFVGNFVRLNMSDGAKLTLIERVENAQQRIVLIEADLGADVQLDHIRLAPELPDRLLLQFFADLGARADFRSFNLVAPSPFRRLESVVNLNGDEAHVSIAGANLLQGEAFHDDTVYVTHNAENCTSRQVFKRVIGAKAHSIFQGKIYVKEGAQKTDGYQISQGLMLEEGGEALSKPELEIYADDVACSHGSTTSGLDETALFYLRSRGVRKEVAEKLLVRAFLEEAFEEIRDEKLAGQISALAEEWIFGQAL